MLFGRKRNKSVIHPRQRPRRTRRQKTWAEGCHSHTVLWWYICQLSSGRVESAAKWPSAQVCHRSVNRGDWQSQSVPTSRGREGEMSLGPRGWRTCPLLSMDYTDKGKIRAESVWLGGSVAPNQLSISSTFARA